MRGSSSDTMWFNKEYHHVTHSITTMSDWRFCTCSAWPVWLV